MADPWFCEADRVRIRRGVEEILSGALSMGPNVRAFEHEFARLVGVRHAIAMSSCTAALETALGALGVSAGDEVIVPCETFIATGMAVHLAGGVPVFAEISESTFCLDLEDVKARLSSRTRGIILVYMAGLIPPNILEFRKFCDDHGLFLIEDAAHAPGARRGKVAGAFGQAGCFSFFPTKVITAGEGGMLTTDDDAVAEYARSLRNRGIDMNADVERYCLPGRNIRMTEMAALVGRVQLSHLTEYLEQRRRVAAIYRDELGGNTEIRLIVPDDTHASSYWKVPALLPDGTDRSGVTKALKRAGIIVDWTYQPALHLQPVFRQIYATHEGLLPRSEQLLSRHICLPCHPRISDDDARYVATTLKAVLSSDRTTK